MTKRELRIVYMGTPDFAVPALDALVSGGYNVVGVVTMPDKPVGRHQNQLQASPVKLYALEHGIRVLQPEKLKDEGFLCELRSLGADLQVVVAFRMLPEVVWAMPRLGTFNLHAALLPQYRGAAPINWAIINGETRTGVTTFFLDKDIDTGAVIMQRSVEIGPDDDAEVVHDRLMALGAELVCETVQDIVEGRVRTVSQNGMVVEGDLHAAPKIFRETCEIRWGEHTAQTAHNFVRGLSPYPGAWCMVRDAVGREMVLKVLRTMLLPEGSVAENVLDVVLEGGVLRIVGLQLAGKKRMSREDFLRGTRVDGWQLV